MEVQLQRITSEYIDCEDRIRLVAEVDGGPPVVLWLSQRMLRVMLPALILWLDSQQDDSAYGDLLQGFAQQAAQAALAPQPPVRAGEEASHWLVQSVDMAQSAQTISLRFRDDGKHAGRLTMEPTPLRQWLGILHTLCQRADWQLQVWPDWLSSSPKESNLSPMSLH